MLNSADYALCRWSSTSQETLPSPSFKTSKLLFHTLFQSEEGRRPVFINYIHIWTLQAWKPRVRTPAGPMRGGSTEGHRWPGDCLCIFLDLYNELKSRCVVLYWSPSMSGHPPQRRQANVGSVLLTPQENESLLNHLGRKCIVSLINCSASRATLLRESYIMFPVPHDGRWRGSLWFSVVVH